MKHLYPRLPPSYPVVLSRRPIPSVSSRPSRPVVLSRRSIPSSYPVPSRPFPPIPMEKKMNPDFPI